MTTSDHFNDDILTSVMSDTVHPDLLTTLPSIVEILRK